MSTEVTDVINTFRMLAELPQDSLGAYVISMARSASDVLAVVLLQRECGVKVLTAQHTGWLPVPRILSCWIRVCSTSHHEGLALACRTT